MPKDDERTLQDIFTDMLVEYRLFIVKTDRLIAEAKEAMKRKEQDDKRD